MIIRLLSKYMFDRFATMVAITLKYVNPSLTLLMLPPEFNVARTVLTLLAVVSITVDYARVCMRCWFGSNWFDLIC